MNLFGPALGGAPPVINNFSWSYLVLIFVGLEGGGVEPGQVISVLHILTQASMNHQ